MAPFQNINEKNSAAPASPACPGLSIIVPAFNEVTAIRAQLQGIIAAMQPLQIPYEIIVVNDGSQDGTEKAAAGFADVTILSHPVNLGYGASLKTGIRHSQYDLICITDADGTYPNDQIPVLYTKISSGPWDMVVGARTGAKVTIPWLRRPAKWALNRLANYLTGIKIPDINSGLRIMRKKAVTPFWHILPEKFSFTTTITLAMLTNSLCVDFIPINYLPRQGKSKIKPIQDTSNFLQLIIRTILYFQPLKIFVPLSGSFFILCFVLFLYRTFIHKAFEVTIIIFFVSGVQLLAIGMLADMINQRLRQRL